MTTVTSSTIFKNSTANVIQFIEDNITDPRSAERTALSSEDQLKQAFVKIKDGDASAYPPQILVELPPSSSMPADTTGVHNIIHKLQFNILVVGRDIIEVMDIADDLVNNFQSDTATTFFENAKMWRPAPFFSLPRIYKHEKIEGQWYGQMEVNFRFFQYD